MSQQEYIVALGVSAVAVFASYVENKIYNKGRGIDDFAKLYILITVIVLGVLTYCKNNDTLPIQDINVGNPDF